MNYEHFQEPWMGARLLLFALCGCLSEQEAPAPSEAALGTTSEPLIFYDGTCTAGQQAKIQRADRIGLVGAQAASWAVCNNGLYKLRFRALNSRSRELIGHPIFEVAEISRRSRALLCFNEEIETSAEHP